MSEGELFRHVLQTYENTKATNERIYREFTQGTDATPWLKEHRDVIERKRWGFGDRAFHYMWLLIVVHLRNQAKERPLRLLEIGVYKGQILSLWALICRRYGILAEAIGVSPLEGDRPRSKVWHTIRRMVDPSYRRRASEGNVYERDDYELAIGQTLAAFGIEPAWIRLIRGQSQATSVLADIGDRRFDAIYIDGDHSYEGARADIENLSSLLEPGGLLVLDDAGYYLPGEGYFKGFPQVSRAAARAAELGLRNVLNVGHNCVFQRPA